MMDKHMSGSDSEGEKRQRMLREQEWLGPNLWSGIGKARLGVGTALVGDGAGVAARLQEYVGEGIDTFILSGYPHLEEAQRFGRYVMPHFAGKASVPQAPREMAAAAT
jgi:alkanesulfonate monooxygenase